MVAWLVDWLIGWSTNWSGESCSGEFNSSTDQIDRENLLKSRKNGSIMWLTDYRRLIDRFMDWLIDLLMLDCSGLHGFQLFLQLHAFLPFVQSFVSNNARQLNHETGITFGLVWSVHSFSTSITWMVALISHKSVFLFLAKNELHLDCFFGMSWMYSNDCDHASFFVSWVNDGYHSVFKGVMLHRIGRCP